MNFSHGSVINANFLASNMVFFCSVPHWNHSNESWPLSSIQIRRRGWTGDCSCRGETIFWVLISKNRYDTTTFIFLFILTSLPLVCPWAALLTADPHYCIFTSPYLGPTVCFSLYFLIWPDFTLGHKVIGTIPNRLLNSFLLGLNRRQRLRESALICWDSYDHQGQVSDLFCNVFLLSSAPSVCLLPAGVATQLPTCI